MPKLRLLPLDEPARSWFWRAVTASLILFLWGTAHLAHHPAQVAMIEQQIGEVREPLVGLMTMVFGGH